jgi:hypothetical protein
MRSNSDAAKVALKLQAEFDAKQRVDSALRERLRLKEYFTNKLAEMARVKQAALEERDAALVLARERAAQRQREADVERRTNKYFDVVVPRSESQYRKIYRDDQYFGESDVTHDAWVPQGPGSSIASGRKYFEGKFKNGHREGAGTWSFESGESYAGLFRNNNMEGPGVLDASGPVLMRDNGVMCYRSQLQPGVHVRLLHSTMMTILRHVHDWRYLCRFHDDVAVKEREVDLSTVGEFVITRSPRWLGVYNHDLEAAGLARRPLSLPGVSNTRYAHQHNNLFESAAAGIGWSRLEDELSVAREEKKGQVSSSVLGYVLMRVDDGSSC